MARKKTTETIVVNAALQRMATVGSYVAACSNTKLQDAFHVMPNGEALYNVFVSAMNTEIEAMFRDDGQEEGVDLAQEKLESLNYNLDTLSNTVKNLTNERLFAVLNVIIRNFGGTPIPPPAQQATPRAEFQPAPVTQNVVDSAPEKPKKTTLSKKFAATSTREVQQQEEPQQQSPQSSQPAESRQAAPSLPPRGNRITGLM